MTDTHCIAVSFDPEVHTADNRRLKVGYASRYPDYSRTRRVRTNEIPARRGKALRAQAKAGAGVYRGDCGESIEGVSV